MSTIDATPVDAFDDLPAADRVQALLALRDRVDAAIVAAVAVTDADGSWDSPSTTAVSLTGWLRSVCRLAPGDAAGYVTAARRLPALPTVAAAFADGRITYGHVRVITRAANDDTRLHAAAGDAETIFVDAAAHTDPSRLGRVVRHWQHTVDDATALAADTHAHERRGVSLSPMLDGMGALDGTLDAEGFAVVHTAVTAVMEADWSPDDPRTPRQRRHDALVRLARSYLDRGDAPTVGGRRPHLSVLVSYDTLAAPPGQANTETTPALLDTGEPICSETARRLACDAAISRIITTGASLPLDVGRSSRTATPAIRRALDARDQGCIATDCDRPLAWCVAHHVFHWAHGGPTALHNLVLLCGFHHHAVHEGGHRIEWQPDGHPVLRAPP